MNSEITAASHINQGKVRDSGIELFRIISMLVIVAHHYVVNSGISTAIYNSASLSVNYIFLLLFGWGGKTGINCFVLITGYFMCKSNITLKKFLKLLLWIYLYRILLTCIFAATGYHHYSIGELIRLALPVTSVADGFISAYPVFYLFIPFLNILIKGMNKKQHLLLMILCVAVYTGLATIRLKVVFNYVTWFSVIYIIGAYIRLYPQKWFDSRKLWGCMALAMLILSWLSVAGKAYVTLRLTGKIGYVYSFVADSNMPLALATAICAFMFFKNLNICYHKLINVIAASAFGVLLIHANSDIMRQWLWTDTLNNVSFMETQWVYIHAFGSVIAIYTVCTIIDLARFNLLEKPFFKRYDALYERIKK